MLMRLTDLAEPGTQSGQITRNSENSVKNMGFEKFMSAKNLIALSYGGFCAS